MSAGLFGLLDDIAVLARLAAASVDDVGAAAARASAKAAGVVVDDTAVTPQYVHGVAATRELPIIKRIAVGSLRNKLLFILPAALLLSQFLPWLLTPILMVGGTYLAFEGAEKIWGRIRGHHDHEQLATELGEDEEHAMIAGAIRTDFILSAEIMVIALNEVADESFVPRAIILAVVAVLITIAVYGVVALIVKMDDVGLLLTQRPRAATQRIGHALVSFMPTLLNVISVVGVAAMIWVGGHILLVGADDLGWHAPYSFVHHLEEDVHHAVPGIGGLLGWLVNTVASALVGLLLGAIAVAVMHVLPFGHGGGHGAGHADGHDAGHADGHEGETGGEPEAAPESTHDGADGEAR
jgi:predicted DNA repair protein MutK